MNYELKHMDVLHAVCYKFAPEGEFNFHDSSAYWYGKDFSTVSKAEYQEIAAHSDAEIGIWLDPDAVTGEFFYFFGPIVPEGVNRIPAGMEKIEIPEADYAVFSVPPAQDADALHANIQKVWEDIFEWFHTDDEYKATSKKCIFEYYSGDTTAIYVPVVKAKYRIDRHFKADASTIFGYPMRMRRSARFRMKKGRPRNQGPICGYIFQGITGFRQSS